MGTMVFFLLFFFLLFYYSNHVHVCVDSLRPIDQKFGRHRPIKKFSPPIDFSESTPRFIFLSSRFFNWKHVRSCRQGLITLLHFHVARLNGASPFVPRPLSTREIAAQSREHRLISDHCVLSTRVLCELNRPRSSE